VLLPTAEANSLEKVQKVIASFHNGARPQPSHDRNGTHRGHR
jgi:hypothetical protein